MKKLSLFMFMLLPALCFGGDNQQKLFDEAIKAGLSSKGCYYYKNTKNKFFDEYETQDYANAHGYIIISLSSKYHVRFGNRHDIVDEIEFIDAKNYPIYAYHALAASGFDFGTVKNTGIIFVAGSEATYEKVNSLISVRSGSKTVFKHYNALWTGNVSNGYIDGHGVGFYTVPGGTYIRVEGTFSMGFPVSEITVKSVTKTDMKYGAAIKDEEIQASTTAGVSQLSLAQNHETDDAVLRKALQLYSQGQYAQDVARLDALYEKVKTLSISNYEDFPLDDYQGNFIRLYQTENYDPSNALSKAWEINDAFYVVEALKMPFQNHYYGYSLWSILSMYYDWLDKEEKRDREMLEAGLEKARKWGNQSDGSLKDFFAQAADRLQQKKQDFEKKISTDRAEYNRLWESERADRKAYEEKQSKEIDWERSKGPSGELTSGLFDTYWYYEKQGVIRFKSGSDYVEYNAFYRDRNGRDFDHFSIYNASNNVRDRMGNDVHKRFKNMGEMVDAILKARR